MNVVIKKTPTEKEILDRIFIDTNFYYLNQTDIISAEDSFASFGKWQFTALGGSRFQGRELYRRPFNEDGSLNIYINKDSHFSNYIYLNTATCKSFLPSDEVFAKEFGGWVTIQFVNRFLAGSEIFKKYCGFRRKVVVSSIKFPVPIKRFLFLAEGDKVLDSDEIFYPESGWISLEKNKHNVTNWSGQIVTSSKFGQIRRSL